MSPDARRIEYVSLKKLRADPRNPKAHDGDAISHSVARFGYVEPVVIDERTGFIVSGHGRVKTLTRMRADGEPAPEGVTVTAKGDWKIPVVHGWRSTSDAESGAALIAMNRTTELGGWVDEALLDLLHEIDDAEGVGFGAEDIDDLEAAVAAARAAEREELLDPDDAPALRNTPRSALGDVWILGDHRVICGDATDPATYATLLDGERADVLWTDPPYGVEYVGKTKDALTIQNDGAGGLGALLVESLTQAVSSLRAGAPVYCCTPPGAGQLTFWRAMESVGVDVRQQLIWAKNVMVLGRSDYHYRHEPILYGFTPAGKGGGRLGRGGKHWHGGNTKTTVLPIDAPKTDRRATATLGDLARAILDGSLHEMTIDPLDLVEALLGGAGRSTVFEIDKPPASREHPTMKPIALIEAMLTNSARAGDVVLDIFGGSGSTLIAAERMGLSARLIELDPVYVDAIVDRWEGVTGQKARRL